MYNGSLALKVMKSKIVSNLKRMVLAITPVLLTILGVMAMVFGEIDDSPGLMGIGLLVIVLATYINFKNIRN
jgi:hypothetical protein